MRAYYNENNTFACDWLSNLMDTGAIMAGEIDERDIREVQPEDLEGFERVHLFAGIGGWDRALELADWGARQVWTGSVPCQPYSVAGKRSGASDPRHLWPELFRLVRQCRPDVVFGEQVTGAIAHGWLDDLSADLESEGYAVGATVLGAHCVGAPHLRQRLWWVAHTERGRRRARGAAAGPSAPTPYAANADGGVADSDGGDASPEGIQRGREYRLEPQDGGTAGGMGDAGSTGRERRIFQEGAEGEGPPARPASAWGSAQLIQCRDGKWRAAPDPESGVLPLAHGVPCRVGRLRAYGNAIVPDLGAEFVRAYMECR